jgi:hypothetical protein
VRNLLVVLVVLLIAGAFVAGYWPQRQELGAARAQAAEGARTADATARTALAAVLVRRDTVTAGLARGEASVRETLAPIAREPRRALGYPLPPVALPGAPAEARP